MIIGVVGRPTESENGRFFYKLSNELKEVIFQYQGVPLLITGPSNYEEPLNNIEKERLHQQIRMCDGIILQGGSEIYPYDHEMITYIEQENIPVLGICLGMQAMAEHAGGKIGKIPEDYINHAQKAKEYVHFNQVKRSSKLFQILQVEEIKVNSRHHDMVLSTNLDCSSYSTDGVIEAVENGEKDFFIGVQWHPESMFEYDKVSRKLWQTFFDSTRRYHEARCVNRRIEAPSNQEGKKEEN